MKNPSFVKPEEWKLCHVLQNGVSVVATITDESDRKLLHKIGQQYGLISLCPNEVVGLDFSKNDEINFAVVETIWCSSAYTLLINGLQIKHMKRRIVSTNAHELARMKNVIFLPADRRQESFIPLSRDKSFIVFPPCRKAMAFACQAPCPACRVKPSFVSLGEINGVTCVAGFHWDYCWQAKRKLIRGHS